MDYVKVILFLSIGLTFAEAEYDPQYNQYLNQFQLPNQVYPMHYEVKLKIDTDTHNSIHDGQVYINVRILSTNPVLILKTRNLVIEDSWTRLTSIDKSFSIPGYHVIGYDIETLITYFDDFVPLGNYTLRIKFKSISQDDFFESYLPRNTTYLQDERLIMKHIENYAARQLFPCWDDPLFKATFDIAVQHSKKYTVLSNMPLKENNINDHNDSTIMISSEFQTTPIMSIHELMIVLLPFTVTRNAHIFHTWCESNTILTIPFATSFANKVSHYLQRYTDISPGIPKIDYIVIWNIQHSESRWGLIIYRESDIIYDKTKDAPYIKKDVAFSITFEVARQWFGGLITPTFKTHSWLCKSFAIFLSHYVIDQIHKEWVQIYFMVVDLLHSLLDEDNIHKIPVLFDETKNYTKYLLNFIYDKGSLLLRMLQHIMGEVAFRKGVITFLNRHKYGVVTTDDLWSAMQTALNATSESKVDIKKVMDSWITQRGYPLVTVKRDYVTGKTIISQKAYNTPDVSKIISESYVWWIPVTWTKESSVAFDETTPTLWLGPENKTISIITNPDEWIIINLQHTGYYRVHYDRTNWEKIANYLKNEDYSNIHVLNRAQIIDDICNMFELGYIDWTLFSLVTSYLSRETNYLPWIPMLSCLNDIVVFFSFPESKQVHIHFANYFDSIFNEIGYEEDPTNLNDDDFTKMARKNLAFYACFFGNPTCRNAAGDKLTKYLADPTGHQILPWWKYWTFCYGLKTTNATIWHKMFRLYLEGKDEMFVMCLHCTEHISVVIDFLYIIIRNEKLIKEKDLPLLIDNIINYHIHNNQLFPYILQLTSLKTLPANYIFDRIIENLYSVEKLDELLQFIRIFTNDFRYDNKIEQRQQKIRTWQKSSRFYNIRI